MATAVSDSAPVAAPTGRVKRALHILVTDAAKHCDQRGEKPEFG